MTRQRLVLLLGGILALGGLFFWRGVPSAAFDSRSPDAIPVRPLPPASAPASSDTENAGLVSLQGATMGTTYRVSFVDRRPVLAEVAKIRVEAALAEVNASMSTYDPRSELMLLNKTRADMPVRLSDELLEVLLLSRRVHDITNGAFDVTVAPLVRAFGFGAQASEASLSDAELEALAKTVGMRHVAIDEAAGTITKGLDSVNIDLSAIAKGYGVDRVAEALEAMGIDAYLVEVGGEIRIKGEKAAGRPWTLAIEYPSPEQRRIYMTLTLKAEGQALATSGDYRNFRKVGDRLISHTIDPRKGRPVPRQTASVSVLRPTTAEADALATGLGVLSPDEALELAEEQQWEVLLLLHRQDGTIEPRASTQFAARHALP